MSDETEFVLSMEDQTLREQRAYMVANQPTLRDLFAMSALCLWCPYDGVIESPGIIAEHVYAVADAMLQAREVKP